MVAKESVDEFHAMMPKKEDVALIHPVDAKPDELGNIVEVSLACRYVPWVNINAFKAAKEQLARRRIIAVRP